MKRVMTLWRSKETEPVVELHVEATIGLPEACRYVPVFRIFPHFAAQQKRRIFITAYELGAYGDSGSPSHNPEVGGSNPPPAIVDKDKSP